VIGFNLGFILAGSALIETVFGWPGIGRLLFDSISSRDYPTMLGILLLVSVSVVLANLATDIVHRLLDPRSADAADTGFGLDRRVVAAARRAGGRVRAVGCRVRSVRRRRGLAAAAAVAGALARHRRSRRDIFAETVFGTRVSLTVDW